jgi:2-methylisocitrate lyase-like PEP mutase family enzyme
MNGSHTNGGPVSQNDTPRPMSAASRLRAMLSRPGHITACPGVYDGLTARIAIAQGFPCIYMTGAGTAASKLGMPDLGLVTMNDMLANASMIASLDRTIPLIADADTGYGGPPMVSRTVKGYISAGIAGMHIEDQVLMKRCGHLGGKEIVGRDEYYSRIRAAVMAREEERTTTGGDIVIIARTDALQSYGFDEAIERLKTCIEIGADVAFLEGVTSKEEAKKFTSLFEGVPCLLNNVPGGATPDMDVEEARKLGYRLIIYPGLALNAVMLSVTAAYKELYEKGSVHVSDDQLKAGVKRMFNVVGLQECIAFDAKAGGTSYSKGV